MLAYINRMLPARYGSLTFSNVGRLYYSSKEASASSFTKEYFTPEIGLSAPEGVRSEFFEEYSTIIKRLMPGQPEHPPMRLSSLNKLFIKVESPDELRLMPDLVERWRRRDLAMTVVPSRFFFRLAEKYGIPDFGFDLLADRHRYGLSPRTHEFNRVLNAYASQAPHLNSDNTEDIDSQVELWGEKMVMTYGLMSLYNCKPNQETADILIPALINSPLAPVWALRLVKLVRELTDAGAVINDTLLEPIIKHRNNYNEVKPQKVSE